MQVSQELDLRPLSSWEKNNSPVWYREYNDVKHSRGSKFNKASLENVLNSTAAVFILLYARYGISALCQYQETQMTHEDEEGFIWREDSLFRLKLLSS